MPSRWTDSGIDWANLNLHKERTSWVIDELYRAMKEKDSLVRYARDIESAVNSWDSLYSQRDEIKLDEIITQIMLWLEPVFDSGTVLDGQYAFYDYQADIVSDWTPLFATSPYFGAKWFDSSIGGNLELLVGDLSMLRDWDVTQSRISSELLQLIYDVLSALTIIYACNSRGATRNIYTSGLNTASFLSTSYLGQDAVFATAVSEYNASSTADKNNDTEVAQIQSFSQWRLTGIDCVWGDGVSPRDSSNNVISMNGGVFYNLWYWDNETSLEFPSVTYDVFNLTTNIGGTVVSGTSVDDFPNFQNNTNSYKARARTFPLIELDDHIIQYYTP